MKGKNHIHPLHYKGIVNAKLFMDARFADRIDLSNISDAAFFSKFHFIRLFKSIYGQTPHQYLTNVRISKARELLRTGVSVTIACYAVGFDSLGSFSTLFKRRTGQTPAMFRRYHELRQAQMSLEPLRFIPNCFAEQKGWTKKSNFQEIG